MLSTYNCNCSQSDCVWNTKSALGCEILLRAHTYPSLRDDVPLNRSMFQLIVCMMVIFLSSHLIAVRENRLIHGCEAVSYPQDENQRKAPKVINISVFRVGFESSAGNKAQGHMLDNKDKTKH